MKISALNSINQQRTNNQNITKLNRQNNINNFQNENTSLPVGNYGQAQVGLNKKYNPSFGFDPVMALAFLGYALFYAGSVGLAVYQSNLDDKKRAEEAKRVAEETENSINEISKKLNVSYKEAQDIIIVFLDLQQLNRTMTGMKKD